MSYHTIPITTLDRVNGRDPFDRDFFIIITRSDNGELWTEQQRVLDMTEDEIVADISGGQYTNISAVFCFNPVEHCVMNVTEDIANQVLTKQLDDYGDVSEHVRQFLENALGCQAVAESIREHRS